MIRLVEFVADHWPWCMAFCALLGIYFVILVQAHKAEQELMPKVPQESIPIAPVSFEPPKSFGYSLVPEDEIPKERNWSMRIEVEPVRVNGELRQLTMDVVAIFPDRVLLTKNPPMALPECKAKLIAELDGITSEIEVKLLIGVDPELPIIFYRLIRTGLLTGHADSLPVWFRDKMWEFEKDLS